MVEASGWDCYKFKEDWILEKRELGIRLISNRKYGHIVQSASYTQEKPSTELCWNVVIVNLGNSLILKLLSTHQNLLWLEEILRSWLKIGLK